MSDTMTPFETVVVGVVFKMSTFREADGKEVVGLHPGTRPPFRYAAGMASLCGTLVRVDRTRTPVIA
ncbi:hypothetical protein LMTR13_07845 [Bradyrhizobium icense]|uniref:Uncharacterized protein n=1 Tax=Bradyrhizobium icense TaxID=1274631 RepID=A0A1B1UBH3_9BRAD|nr:hypothetical protein LMTR13_07845 [Bradyrhizobium icense]